MPDDDDAVPAASAVRVQLVIGIVRRDGEVLLVRERLGRDGELLWSLPGGGAQTGELLHEALRREMREETGLLVGDPVGTAFLVHVDSPQHPSAIAMAFELAEWEGTLASHDDEVTEARFFPVEEAIALVGELPSDAQRDPIVGYLSGTVVPGTTWLYRTSEGRDTLLARW
ncbi:8-oxo-dGTP diphosphatase [Micromonospora pallida]|uniref:8-oxo-dGTP diphosphatase n=1 Tax=Micromonospora pallida TaxID=145854 RepID=A0A1C6T5M6_9ACTN|nr:NUDIX hydrolase [Micromonospora pallida]SCL36987.1 8-oxo-dGTP diphosphatase [Micromonospora pallida]